MSDIVSQFLFAATRQFFHGPWAFWPGPTVEAARQVLQRGVIT